MKMTIEEKIAVIKAYDEGKEVEVYDDNLEGWCKKSSNDFWDFDIYIYRVKPPKPTRLEVANAFWEKNFGIKNAFNKESCVSDGDTPCSSCPVYCNGKCNSEIWWNASCDLEEKK